MTLLLALACTASEPIDPSAWELVWSDEFDQDGAPNPDNWQHDVGGDGWGNQQLEYNTDRIDNAEVVNGWLQLRAMREDYEGNSWTSARIKTQDLFEHEGGRFAAHIQLPPGTGIWPAFWMLGANFDEVGWPACGEIDILEARGQDPYTTNAAVRGTGFSGGDAVYDSLTVEDNLQEGSHIYAVEWDEDHIAWFLDDQLVHKVHPGDTNGSWPFDQDFFLILNVAVGGTYVGPPDDSTPDTSTMYVDFVRVYERAE